MELSQSEFEQVVENWSNGAPSPFYEGERRLWDAQRARVVTFAGEELCWIGTVDTDMFSDRGNKDFGVYIGVTPYRVVFYRQATVFGDLCRSYWFEVDVEGRTWQEGRVRKKEYGAISVVRPTFKKGMMSQKIIVAGRRTRVGGKEDTVFEHELFDLKWLNPQTSDFEGGKGQNLYDQLLEAYDNRISVSVSNLWLMQNDSVRAILITPGLVAEGEAVREEPMRSMPPAAPESTLAPELPSDIEVEAISGLGPQPSVEACVQCGNPLKPGVSFCGNCGCPVEAGPVEEQPPQAEEIPMDNCPACGSPLKPGIGFCGNCGCLLERELEEEGPIRTEATIAEHLSDGEVVAGGEIANKCPDCGKRVEADWMVCAYCAASLPAQCPECGKATAADWKVCPYCGTALNR